jgi:hypothetical protein
LGLFRLRHSLRIDEFLAGGYFESGRSLSSRNGDEIDCLTCSACTGKDVALMQIANTESFTLTLQANTLHLRCGSTAWVHSRCTSTSR